MSEQYPGGFITKSPPTPSGAYQTSTASGMWNLSQQAAYAKQGIWPTQGNIAPTADAQFNYVTMLLHGDGTNGAQNNTFLDSSTNNFTITRVGNTTQGSYSPYGSNWSNFFPNASPATSYLVSSSVSLSGDFTIEGYVNWNGEGPNPAMFTLGDSSLSTGIEVYRSGSTWLLFASNGVRVTGSAAVIGQWTYIAVTRSGTTVTLYINGVSQGTWTSSQTFSGTIKVGAEFYGSTYYSSMSGYISNFRVNNTTAINTVPTVPLTAVSGTIFLTCQSNRFIDNSASPLTITVTGTPSVQRFNPFGASTAYSTSVIGGSSYFEGSADYLTLASGSTFSPSGNYITVEAWVYSNGAGGDRTVFSRIQDGAPYSGYDLRVDGGTAPSIDAGGSTTTSSITCNAFAWNYIVWQFDALGNRQIYVNGVRGANVTGASTSVDFNNTPRIGAGVSNGSNWDGYISNLRIIKQATAYYSGTTITVPTAPLTAVTNTQLLTNFTNAGIFDNAMINNLETVGNAQISTSVVKYGTGSLYFDGTGDDLSAPNLVINSLGSGAFTIEMWVYRLGNGTGGSSAYDALLGSNIDNPTALYGVYVTRSSGVISFFSSAGLVSSSNSLSNSTWTHVAVCRTSANNLQIFINGVSGYSATNTGTGTLTFPFFVASDNTSNGNSNFYGYIDDLRITKGYARYTANFTPPTAAFPDYGPT